MANEAKAGEGAVFAESEGHMFNDAELHLPKGLAASLPDPNRLGLPDRPVLGAPALGAPVTMQHIDMHTGLVVVCVIYLGAVTFWSYQPTFWGLLTLYPEAEEAVLLRQVHVANIACTAAFAAASASNVLIVISQMGTLRHDVSVLGLIVNMVALLFFGSESVGYGHLYLGALGRPVAMTRITMWLFTSPCMLAMLTTMADRDNWQLTKYVAAQVALLLVQVPAYFVRSATLRGVLHAASLLLFAYVVANIRRMLTEAVEETGKLVTTASTVLLHIISATTTVMWLTFPSIHFAAEFGLLSPLNEWRAWCLADTITKTMYNAALLYSSIMTTRTRASINTHIARVGERETLLLELDVLLKSRELLFKVVSHELRTPLHGIVGLTTAILQQEYLSAADAQSLEVIKSSGERMLSLITDVLESLQKQRKTLPVHPTKVGLHREVTDAIATVRPMCKSSVSLVNRVSQKVPKVRADPARLMQILLNLLSNAIRFTPSGSVTIAAEPSADQRMVVLKVIDTGVGIAPENHEKIFTGFSSAHDLTVEKLSRDGLGLSVVRQLVESHGGRVWVESELGRGSTFCLTLPIYKSDALRPSTDEAPPAPRRMHSPTRSPRPPQARRSSDLSTELMRRVDMTKPRHLEVTGNALIICNDEDSQVLEYLKQMKQVDVALFADDESILSFIAENDSLPDCVLLAAGADAVAANSLCSRLRKLIPSLPIIIITSSQNENSTEASLQAGATDHLAKPFSCDELCARITAHVQQKTSTWSARRDRRFGELVRLVDWDAEKRPVRRGASDWKEFVNRSLATGKEYALDHAAVMLLGLKDVPKLVGALGVERTMALLSTWFSQCLALAKSEEVVIVGGLATAVTVLSDQNAKHPGLSVLQYGRKMLQWADTINASLKGVNVSIKAVGGVAEGPLSIALDCLSDVPSPAHVNVLGPAVRRARKLHDRACAGCLNVAPTVRQALKKKELATLNLSEASVLGETMMHLPGHLVLETPVDTAVNKGFTLELHKQTLAGDQMAALALLLNVPQDVLGRVCGSKAAISFDPADIEVERQNLVVSPREAAQKAQLELTITQCLDLYSCIRKLHDRRRST